MDITLVDAFDLPEWLGTEPVVWRAHGDLETAALVPGELRGTDDHLHGLDLLAVDAAYPRPVCPDKERSAAHQAWQFGEVALLDIDGRLAAGAPGTRFSADLVCEVVRRVARAVGAERGSFSVSITL
jgi:hypothetical protein